MTFSAARWVFCALFYPLSTFAAAQQTAANAGREIVPSQAFSGEELAALPVERVADMDNASTIYDNACSACHGEQGEGSHGGVPDIRNSVLSLSEIMLVINAGRNTMPAFAGFTEQELLDISTFVQDAL